MRTLRGCAAVLILLLATSLLPAERTVRVALHTCEPILFVEDQQVRGLGAEVLQRIAEVEGWRLEYTEPRDWESALESVRTGEADLIFPVVSTPAREQLYDFSQVTLVTVWGRLFARAESPIHTLLDARDLKVGGIADEYFGEEIQRQLLELDGSFEYRTYPNVAALFEAAQNGDIDCAAAADHEGFSTARRFELEPKPVVFSPNAAVFVTAKGQNLELLTAIDRSLAELKKGDFYRDTYDRWFNQQERRSPWLAFFVPLAVVAILGLSGATLQLKRRLLSRHTELSRRNAAMEKEIQARAEIESRLMASNQLLTAERAFFRQVLDREPSLVYLLDERDCVALANRAFCEFFRRSEKALLGAPIDSVIPEIKPPNKSLKDTDAFQLDLRREGTVAALEIRQVSIESLDGKPGTLGIGVDVTPQVSHRRRLELEKQCAAVFFSSNDDMLFARVACLARRETHSPLAVVIARGEDGMMDCLAMHEDGTTEFGRATPENLDSVKLLKGEFADAPCELPEPVFRRARAIGAEVRFSDRRLAKIIVCDRHAPYSEHDLACLQLIANTAAPFLQARQDKERAKQRQMLADAETRNSERKYRQLFNSMTNAFVLLELIHDALGRPSDLRVVEANAALERHTGLPHTKIVGCRLQDVSPQFNAEIIDVASQTVASGEARRFVRHSRAFNRTLDVFVYHTEGDNVAVIFSDVTPLRQAEKERTRWATAIQRSSQNLALLDREGRFEYVNPAFAKLSGRSVSELCGSDFSAWTCIGDVAEIDRLRMAINHGHSWHARFERGSGADQTRELEVTLSPVHNDEDELESFVAFCHDATVDTRLEKKLRHIEKMEAVGQLAGGLAHDFNNMLQAIIGNNELTLKQLTPEHMAHESAWETGKAAERASMLVRQLLAFSRHETLKPRWIDLNETILDMVNLLRRLMSERIDLRFEPDPNLHSTLADSSQIGRLIINLCVNARDAMPNGGQLLIATKNLTLTYDQVQSHPWCKPGDFVRLSVRDEGMGIPDAIQDRIFEPFFTTKPTGEGTGLGLSTVFAIVKRHNGMITVDSVVGKGTRFNIDLPGCPSENPEPIDDYDTDPPAPNLRSDARVLVAEDDPMVRAVCRQLLQDAGCKVELTIDGEAAFELFQKDPAAWDLALIDMMMPRLNGLELHAKLREARADLPIIITTGGELDSIASQIEDKLTRYLPKPYRSAELLECVRKSLPQLESALNEEPER